MKKFSKLMLFLICIGTIFGSCERDITTLNEDPKNPGIVDPNYIFTSAQLGIATQMANTSVNWNNFRYFTQQLTECQYVDEAAYNILKRSMPDNHWNTLYLQLNKLSTVKSNLTGNDPVTKNKIATINALEIYIYSVLVDSYGDVPYSQAIKIEEFPSPKYDDAKTIYVDLINRANSILQNISTTAVGFTGSDAIFGGDMNKVKLFVNSLKLRLGLNLADVDQALSKSTVESAYTSGLILSNADNIGLKFDVAGLYTSPIYQDVVQSGRNDYVAANTLVNYMNTNLDPRRAKYFTTINGAYVGGIYGKKNTYANFSHINPDITVKDYKFNLFDYSETAFSLAEAAERGYSVGASAATYFAQGISASMDFWGVSAAEKAAYLASHNYSTMTGTWKEKIGNEAWVSMYNRGFEAWETSRRLDYRIFVKPSTYDLPTRLPYPTKEGSVNKTNMEAAVTKQWGDITGNVQGKKLFWDKN